MKPVVTSFVALALAMSPLCAMAKPAHPHKTHTKIEKQAEEGKIEKTDKIEKKDKSSLSHVKHGKKNAASLKKVVHHAEGVDLVGAGHKEPSTPSVVVPVSLKSHTAGVKAHGKSVAKPAPANTELPKLPSASANKPSKGGAEKGVRKPTGKKAASDDDNSGEPARDEDLAELVARDHGTKTGTEPAKELKQASQKAPKHECRKGPVEIVRGPEVERFELTTCDGNVAPLAVERLSILVRPGGVARPTAPVADLAKKPGDSLARGIRRVDKRLVARLQSIIDHFGKSDSSAKLAIISGYRPASVGSMHSSGRAIDFRVEGVKNEEVVAFCKTLDDTGCGYYPNSSFVHIDVREPGAGHITWIDASGPGETPHYVASWPPPDAEKLQRASVVEHHSEELVKEGEKLLRAERPIETIETHGIEIEGSQAEQVQVEPSLQK